MLTQFENSKSPKDQLQLEVLRLIREKSQVNEKMDILGKEWIEKAAVAEKFESTHLSEINFQPTAPAPSRVMHYQVGNMIVSQPVNSIFSYSGSDNASKKKRSDELKLELATLMEPVERITRQMQILADKRNSLQAELEVLARIVEPANQAQPIETSKP